MSKGVCVAVYATIFSENDFEEEKLALLVFGAVSLITLVLSLGRLLMCPKEPDIKAMLDQYGLEEGGYSSYLSNSSSTSRQFPRTTLILDDWTPETDSEFSVSPSLAPCATLASAADMDVVKLELDESNSGEDSEKFVLSFSDSSDEKRKIDLSHVSV